MSNGFWHESRVNYREDRVAVKLANADGSFKKSIVMPTMMYPLNGKYEVFSYANTEVATDEEVLRIFDSMKYHIGHCYQNTDNLVTALREAGYDAKSYVGWLFVQATDYPVHHCWCVLNGNIILDLADDYSLMLGGENGELFQKAKNIEEYRELMVSFAAWAKGLRNRDRCTPVGTPTPFLLYVGCECSPQEGRRIYNKLIADYPDHESQRNCNEDGWNATQKKMQEAGLM